MVEMIQSLAKLITILIFMVITLAVLLVIVWPVFGGQIQLFMCAFTAYVRSEISQILWSTITTIMTIVIIVGMILGFASMAGSLKGILEEWQFAKAEAEAEEYTSFLQLAREHVSAWVRSGAAKSAVKWGIAKYGILGIFIVGAMAMMYNALPLACPILVDQNAGTPDSPLDKETFLNYVGDNAATTWNIFLAGRGNPLFFRKPNPWPLIALHYNLQDGSVSFEEIKDVVEKRAKVKYEEDFIIIYKNDVLSADKLGDRITQKEGEIFFMFIDTYGEGFYIFAMENLVPECNSPFLWYPPGDSLVVCIVPS